MRLVETIAKLRGMWGTDLLPRLRPVLLRTALRAEAEAKRLVSGPVLKVRTGRLRASIRGSVEESAEGIQIVLRAGVRYAAIHEYGGVIRATGKLLKVPVGPALTGAAPRMPATRNAQGRFVKGREALSFRPGGNGGALVDSTGRAWFLLRRQVKIPRRPFLAPALAAAVPSLIQDLEREVSNAI